MSRPPPSGIPAWRPLPSLALLAAILIVGSGLIAADLLAMRENDASIAAGEASLASLREAVERSTASAGAPQEEVAASPFLPGETETIAAAALQAMVLGAIEGRSATVLSADAKVRDAAASPQEPSDEARPAGAEGSGRVIDLEVAFDARIADLQAILFQLETSRPTVTIDALRLQPVAEGDDRAPVDPLLHAVMSAHGTWRK